MYLPREAELSRTWVFPGILLLPRKRIQIKIGKLANNLVLRPLIAWLCLAYLDTQSLFVYTS